MTKRAVEHKRALAYLVISQAASSNERGAESRETARRVLFMPLPLAFPEDEC